MNLIGDEMVLVMKLPTMDQDSPWRNKLGDRRCMLSVS
jgi:hypothetical protein